MGGGSKIGDYTVDELEETLKTVQTINSQKMYSVRIESNGPLIMRNKDDTTTLKCIVESWGKDVTEDIDASNFVWIRTSNNEEADKEWNENSDHKGCKQIQIKREDVAYNATFSCEVEVQEDG